MECTLNTKSRIVLVAAAACVGLAVGGCSSKGDSKGDSMEGGSGMKHPDKGLPPGGESPGKPPIK